LDAIEHVNDYLLSLVPESEHVNWFSL
jgi:hypothetical protein